MKALKMGLFAIILFIVTFIICWLFGGFICQDYYVANWQQGSRFTLLFLASLVSLYATGILAIHGVFK